MRRKSIIPFILTVLLSFSFFATPVSAAIYETAGTRGIKYLAWSKSILIWKTNSSKVIASDPDQNHSGIFVRNKGMTKVNSLTTSTQHAWNYKNEFLAGAKLGGVTLGFSDTITDRIIGKRNGTASFRWDI